MRKYHRLFVSHNRNLVSTFNFQHKLAKNKYPYITAGQTDHMSDVEQKIQISLKVNKICTKEILFSLQNHKCISNTCMSTYVYGHTNAHQPLKAQQPEGPSPELHGHYKAEKGKFYRARGRPF